MARLDHTIVASHDAEASARFLAELMDLEGPVPFGHFQMVKLAGGTTLDFADAREGEEITPQHYAFLVDEDEFDLVFGRIVEQGLDFWADPGRTRKGEINDRKGRGCYFLDPSGHLLEILTVPYDA